MRRNALITWIGLFMFLTLIPFFTISRSQSPEPSLYEAKVVEVQVSKSINKNTNAPIKNVKLEIVSGNLKGKIVSIQDNTIPAVHTLTYNNGDHLIISHSKGPGNNDIFYITDYARQKPLLLLVFLFLTFSLIVARWHGFTSLLGMIISFFVIGQFIVPNILLGNDPVLITLFGTLFIIPITYYLSHGFNKKATIGIIGTFIALIFTGLLAFFFTELTRLSGFASEEAVFIQTLKGGAINIKSLLLSGIIISVLAVLNDITIAQASVVSSLIKSKPNSSVKELFDNAMNVGKDHVASLVNTLILVYAGASLPLFLLFYNTSTPISFIINQEIIATEIVQTLVSSIGIIASVPITTYLAALSAKKKFI